MRKLILVLAASLITATGHAQQTEGHGPGLGVETTLGGIAGPTFVFDTSRLHFDILFTFHRVELDGPDRSDFGIAGRVFFVLHSMPGADFSLGGGAGIVHAAFNDASEDSVRIEGAAQIRAFIVPNVAVSASLGLAYVTNTDNGGDIGGDDNFLGFDGPLFGSFGLTYFFR